MFGGADLDRFEVREIEDKSIGTNCGPQAVATADRDKGYVIRRCSFYLAVIVSVP